MAVELHAASLIPQPRLRHPFALSRARNAGLRLARGPWIVCLDADCIPVACYFEVLDRVLSSESARLLTGPRIFVQAEALRPHEIVEDASVLSRLPRVASASNYGLSVDRRCRWLGRIDRVEHPWAPFHGCNMVFQRDRALAAGGFDEGYDGTWGYEDQDFAWPLITHHDCRPEAVDALRAYHQEPDRDLPQPHRFSRTDNPNWARICNRIPGDGTEEDRTARLPRSCRSGRPVSTGRRSVRRDAMPESRRRARGRREEGS